ncbi:MAG: glycosyl hydrolase family 79 C-terminal domain-containing protein, partial [Solirubrobacteraceae bacterium]
TAHVVLINDYTAQSRSIDVRIAGAHGAATLERLRGPGVHALTGVTIGGQSFAADTGLLSGPSGIVSVNAGHGAYVVRLPPASAAMLTLPG